jgi:hypothetical protein
MCVSRRLFNTTALTAVRVYYTLQVRPAPAVATFTDVPTSHPFFQFVEALVGAGITAGCAPALYCINSPITAAGWELVDYKTDQADVATLAARYGDQVRQYAVQWGALTGTPVTYAGLYGVREQAPSSELRER